ncbi:hypothetical protein SBA5_970043 [Candidatus Sulfotelmatomonas gaucii]|uniref:Uncharacterized protein n=1 Tax=Candidatus Sulfuritelmatomonas gaucii TaxID=2043161 RepID=A0A2N9MA52_9BACT|nr:hypothetical protein SBA5_970043 [Candidatus Sulfotelmatomonas gaucii]
MTGPYQFVAFLLVRVSPDTPLAGDLLELPRQSIRHKKQHLGLAHGCARRAQLDELPLARPGIPDKGKDTVRHPSHHVEKNRIRLGFGQDKRLVLRKYFKGSCDDFGVMALDVDLDRFNRQTSAGHKRVDGDDVHFNLTPGLIFSSRQVRDLRMPLQRKRRLALGASDRARNNLYGRSAAQILFQEDAHSRVRLKTVDRLNMWQHIKAVIADMRTNIQKYAASPQERVQQPFASPIHIGPCNVHFAGKVVGDRQSDPLAGGQLHPLVPPRDPLKELPNGGSVGPANRPYFLDEGTVHHSLRLERRLSQIVRARLRSSKNRLKRE